jgi:hypothetical protein
VSAEPRKTILFVDYENSGKLDLRQIPADVIVPFFFGASQKSVSTEFLGQVLKLGSRFIKIDIEGQGKNALDFHIAFYLGEYLAAHPKAHCIVLSKDKGFDPLIKHLRGKGFAVRRAPALANAFGNTSDAVPAKAESAVTTPKVEEQSPFAAVVQWLSEMQPRTRPRKRKGLVAHLRSHFGKKISENEADALVERLIAEKKVSEVEGRLGYGV